MDVDSPVEVGRLVATASRSISGSSLTSMLVSVCYNPGTAVTRLASCRSSGCSREPQRGSPTFSGGRAGGGSRHGETGGEEEEEEERLPPLWTYWLGIKEKVWREFPFCFYCSLFSADCLLFSVITLLWFTSPLLYPFLTFPLFPTLNYF